MDGMAQFSISLREAEVSDQELLFEWRNTPSIVALGSLKRTVTWAEHIKWLKEAIRSDVRNIYIIQLADNPVGQIRLDWESDKMATVSIYLIEDHQGKGLGLQALQELCGMTASAGRAEMLMARIHKDNTASVSVFSKAGFIKGASPENSQGYHDYSYNF